MKKFSIYKLIKQIMQVVWRKYEIGKLDNVLEERTFDTPTVRHSAKQLAFDVKGEVPYWGTSVYQGMFVWFFQIIKYV